MMIGGGGCLTMLHSDPSVDKKWNSPYLNYKYDAKGYFWVVSFYEQLLRAGT